MFLVRTCSSLTVNGLWSPSSDFVKVIGRFGFLKSDVHHKDITDGYIFGNVTSTFRSDESKKATLLLIDRSTFIKIYGGKKKSDTSSLTCEKIFSVIDEVAYDKKCKDTKTQDLIRYIPCPRGKFCEGLVDEKKIVPGSQLTFVVEDQKQPT